MAMVWIDSPQNGANVGTTVTVSGRVSPPNTTVTVSSVEIPPSATVVVSGDAPATEAEDEPVQGKAQAFSYPVNGLEVGKSYTLTAKAEDNGGGSASVEVTVTGGG